MLVVVEIEKVNELVMCIEEFFMWCLLLFEMIDLVKVKWLDLMVFMWIFMVFELFYMFDVRG